MDLERIAAMEARLDCCRSAMDDLLEAARAYTELKEEYQTLEAYYVSPAWLEDMQADREGKVPQEMKRGVLSEDAVWDLLTDKSRLAALLQEEKTEA